MSSQQHTDAKSSITKSAMPTAPRWVAWIAGVVGVALCALDLIGLEDRAASASSPMD
jgi:hypothetical protein